MAPAETVDAAEDELANTWPDTDEETEVQASPASTDSSLEDEEEDTDEPTEEATFLCFNKLPAELRLEILDMALPPPRCITSSTEIDDSPPAPSHEFSFQILHTEKCPGMLFACRESRTVALQHCQAVQNVNSCMKHSIHYFDPSRDIWFNRNYCCAEGWDVLAFLSEHIPQLSRLAIQEYDLCPYEGAFLHKVCPN